MSFNNIDRGYNINLNAPHLSSNATTSTTGLIKGGVTTSTTGLIKGRLLKPDEIYYELGENLGNETRNAEFKLGGGGYIKKTLPDHVSKYVCSFLNSGEGGNLYVGVDDNGTVQGIQLTQKEEDHVRLVIDSTIRSMRPHVLPHMYNVSFPKVVQKHGNKIHVIENTVVLKLTVKKVAWDSLYETHRGEAYMRRDGSIQGPMRASEIMEYANVVHSRDLNTKDKEISGLKSIIYEIMPGDKKKLKKRLSDNRIKSAELASNSSTVCRSNMGRNDSYSVTSIFGRLCSIL